MLNVIYLCQLYKQQEIIIIKQIYGYYNLIDFITKAKFSLILKTLINTNYINISITKYLK